MISTRYRASYADLIELRSIRDAVVGSGVAAGIPTLAQRIEFVCKEIESNSFQIGDGLILDAAEKKTQTWIVKDEDGTLASIEADNLIVSNDGLEFEKDGETIAHFIRWVSFMKQSGA